MINYSVSLRGNPMDLSQPKKAYGRVQLTKVMSLDQFAEHIATHGCKYDRGDIYAVLVSAGRCLRELVLQGCKVSLGDLGSFYPSLSSNGADSMEAFTAAHIKCLSMNWDKPLKLEDMTADAEFVQVSSRAAQAAALKAEKAGKTSASWDSTVAPDGEGDSAVTPDDGAGSSDATPGGSDQGGGNTGGGSDDDDANA